MSGVHVVRKWAPLRSYMLTMQAQAVVERPCMSVLVRKGFYVAKMEISFFPVRIQTSASSSAGLSVRQPSRSRE